ncbi:ABC transporter permease [Pseudoalteromonas sp. OOF1S-7]|uniref:ABC transporter permease n=1 Tax=Pseudoalteromonas sp. OOF1S-7 TaxID=2917757 RepID=UPI001EF5C2E9|nr:ABC transporter permease [Pseudoalteromonas sp. OOF1S-7]MCG7534477.1 ABC transporter permease [Pseudoalteromonas sp. OOF1S-7]
MNGMILDIKYALRLMLRNPKFTILTLFVMTTGLTLSIFLMSFLPTSVSATMPFENGEKLRRIDAMSKDFVYNTPFITLHEAEFIAENSNNWEKMGVFTQRDVSLGIGERAISYNATFAQSEFFEVSDAVPLMGRLFDTKDLSSGASPVVIIGYPVYQKFFAQQDDVIGQKIRVNGVPTTIIGVMPESYKFPDAAEIWLPLTERATDFTFPEGSRVIMFGLLKNGITDQQANFEVKQLAREFHNNQPKSDNSGSVHVWSFQDAKMGDGHEKLELAMQLCVGFILILCCINVGNLLFSRAIEKGKETAIRIAIGAPRSRLISQIMWESAIICVVSGCISVAIASVWLDIVNERLPTLLPFPVPFWFDIRITGFSILMAVLLVIVTAVITGILPAVKATGGNFNDVLRAGTRGAQSKSQGRVSKVLVIVEILLSCTLLLASTAMVKTIFDQHRTDYGADIDNILRANVTLPDTYDTAKRQRYYDDLSGLLQRDARVESLSLSTNLPSETAWYAKVNIEGKNYGTNQFDAAHNVFVDENYFTTFGIELLEGRDFNQHDRPDTTLVAVVTENFAKQHWPDESAVGKRVKILAKDPVWYTVVGVVNKVVHGKENRWTKSRGTVYIKLDQNPKLGIRIALKTTGDPYELSETIVKASSQLDFNALAFDINSLRYNVNKRMAAMDFVSEMFLIIAIASLIIAFSGIYGVVSKSIFQKRHETGVKRAIGAQNADIYKFFMVSSAKQLFVGLLLGMPLGIFTLQMLGSTGVAEMHNILLIGIPVSIVLIIALAVVLPTRAVLQKEPSAALRHE